MPRSLVEGGAVVENLQVVFVLQLAAEVRSCHGVGVGSASAFASTSASASACAGRGATATASTDETRNPVDFSSRL